MPPNSLDALNKAAAVEALECFGVLPTQPDDNLGLGTIALLGPREPGFWPHFTASPEFADGAPDPMDRWSTRVITALAEAAGGSPLFPFGQPARPFIGWALRSGQAFVSPASMLVHAKVGLFVSYRGAVFLPDLTAEPAPMPNPCTTCAEKPCLTACPTGAITEQGYDLPACHEFLDTDAGDSCRSKGCAVRRSCPLARNYPRIDAQSEFHMKAFHPWP